MKEARTMCKGQCLIKSLISLIKSLIECLIKSLWLCQVRGNA